MISGRLFCCGVFGVSAAAFAQGTWHVDAACGDDAWTGLSDVCAAPDGPKRTIQAAIDAANAAGGIEDTVLLAPGVYSGDGNQGLQRSGLLTFRSRGGAADTILEGVGPSGPAFFLEFDSPRIEGLTFATSTAAGFLAAACSSCMTAGR